MDYYHQIVITLGCGCKMEYDRIVEEDAPTEESAYMALCEVLLMDEIISICTQDHVEAGQEKIDIKVRTKIGVPEGLV